MKYTIKNTKHDINEFSVIKNSLFLLNKNSKLFLNDELISKGEFSFFGFYNELQFVFDEENFYTLIYDSEGKLIKTIKEYALRNIYTFTNGISLVGGNDGTNTFYGFYDFSKNKMLKHFENIGFNGIYQVINEEEFISKNKERIGLFNFSNEIIWQHTYSNLFGQAYKGGGGVYGIVEIKGKLYINFGKTTFCFDTKTGKIEYRYEDYLSIAENEYLYGFSNSHKNDVMRNQLNILNTTTNTITKIDLYNELKPYNTYPDQKFIVQNGLIYFTQSLGDTIAKVGIIDPNQAKVIWLYNFPDGSGSIGNLKVNGNRIYVHTQDKTLHIFQKQETTIT